MQTSYKTIPMGAYPETLENFNETNCYVTWETDNYLGNEDKFLTAEVLLLGKQLFIEGKKYVFPRYMGKIHTMGLLEVSYNEDKDKFEILKINKLYRDNQELNHIEFDEDSRANLERCLMNHNKNYHLDKPKELWSSKKRYFFIEAKKVNTCNNNYNNIIYKQQMIHEIRVSFDSTGTITDSCFPNRYFKFKNGILYDTQNSSFIKSGEEILLSAPNGEIKRKFINFLLKNHPYKARPEELCKELGLTGFDRNKKLLDYKRSIINTEFVKYLGLTKTEISQKVLSAEKNQGYLLKGKFVSDITTT